MWPILVRVASRYAPYITLPFAAVVGFIGYQLEEKLSSKYTPYAESIQESRAERQTTDESLDNAANVERLNYSADVLGKNVSPSLK